MTDIYDWSGLNKQQLGLYAKLHARAEFVRHGFAVYEVEAPARPSDFKSCRLGGQVYGVRVRSLFRSNYMFLVKERFPLRKDLVVVVALLRSGEPAELFLIPSLAWRHPDALLRDRDYEDDASKPEWGLTLTGQSLSLLDGYRFRDQLANL